MLKSLSLIVALILSQCVSAASAATWTGSVNTDWFNSGNWSGTAPQAGGSALINNSGTVDISAPGAISTTLDMQNGVLNISGGTTTLTTSP